jgi:hypothetical protein
MNRMKNVVYGQTLLQFPNFKVTINYFHSNIQHIQHQDI